MEVRLYPPIHVVIHLICLNIITNKKIFICILVFIFSVEMFSICVPEEGKNLIPHIFFCAFYFFVKCFAYMAFLGWGGMSSRKALPSLFITQTFKEMHHSAF